MKREAWNANHYAKMIEMAFEGKNTDEISAKIGKTPASVRWRRSVVVEAINKIFRRIDDLEKRAERLDLLMQKINFDDYEHIIDKLNRLRFKLSKLVLRYPGLADELGYAVDGLPKLLKTADRRR